MNDRNAGYVDKGWINGKQLPNECNPCLSDLRQLAVAVVLSLVCLLNTRITVSVTCGGGSEKPKSFKLNLSMVTECHRRLTDYPQLRPVTSE